MDLVRIASDFDKNTMRKRYEMRINGKLRANQEALVKSKGNFAKCGESRLK